MHNNNNDEDYDDCMDSVEYWKLKYEECERKLEKLKSLVSKGVEDYEGILEKYEENQVTYKAVCQRLKVTQDQLAQLQQVAEPAIEAFMQLKNKHEIEEKCRLTAENYATAIHGENVSLKRQSTMLLQHIDKGKLTIDELEELSNNTKSTNTSNTNSTSSTTIMFESQRDLINELKGNLLEKDIKYRNLEQERILLHGELNKLKLDKKSNEKTLLHVQSLSKVAVRKYEELEEKYKIEKDLKEKAVKELECFKNDTELKLRLSLENSRLLLESSTDEKLTSAMLEIEALQYKLNAKQVEFDEMLEQLKTYESSSSSSSNSKKNVDKKTKETLDLEKQELFILREHCQFLETDLKKMQIDKQELTDNLKKSDTEINYLRKLIDAFQGQNKAIKESSINNRKSASTSVSSSGGAHGHGMVNNEWLKVEDTTSIKEELHNLRREIDELRKHNANLISIKNSPFSSPSSSSSSNNNNLNNNQTTTTTGNTLTVGEELNYYKKMNKALSQQIESLQRHEKNGRDMETKLKKEMDELRNELDVAQQRLNSNIPLPPPPPPPPSVSFFQPLVDIIKKRKNSKSGNAFKSASNTDNENGSDNNNCVNRRKKILGNNNKQHLNMDEALEEMMNRIRNGKGCLLKKVDTNNLVEEEAAGVSKKRGSGERRPSLPDNLEGGCSGCGGGNYESGSSSSSVVDAFGNLRAVLKRSRSIPVDSSNNSKSNKAFDELQAKFHIITGKLPASIEENTTEEEESVVEDGSRCRKEEKDFSGMAGKTNKREMKDESSKVLSKSLNELDKINEDEEDC